MAISFVADPGHSITVGKGETSGTIRTDQQLRLRRRAIGERIREVSEERDRLSRIWHVTEGCSRYRIGLQIEVLADELGALIALRDAVRDPDDPTWEPPAELVEPPEGLVRLGCQAPVPDYLKPEPVEATGRLVERTVLTGVVQVDGRYYTGPGLAALEGLRLRIEMVDPPVVYLDGERLMELELVDDPLLSESEPVERADQPDLTDRFNNDLAAREQADFEARLRLACADADIRQLLLLAVEKAREALQ
jgi:hypothetical protein